MGAGAIASRDVVQPRPFGLGSVFGFVVRLEAPALLAWCAGAVAAGFAFGMIAKVASGVVSSSVSETLHKFGVQGALVVEYFGVAFLLFGTVIALLPVSPIGTAAGDEASGRVVQLLTQPVGRSVLFGARLAVTTIAIVITALLTGAAAWLGARTQGVDPGFGRMVGAGLNVVPTALLVLGLGAIALALAPRAATGVVYGVVIASLLIDLLSSLVSGAHWVEHISLFHYMALAPAQPVHAGAVVVTLVLAVVCAGVATALYCRRDITA